MKDDKKNMLAKVAYLYYFEEKTQNEIAEELKIYRTTVSRMIKQAKDEGIVKIEIQEFNTQIYALERHMKSKYKLKDIEIVPVVESDSNEKKNRNGQHCGRILGRNARRYGSGDRKQEKNECHVCSYCRRTQPY